MSVKYRQGGTTMVDYVSAAEVAGDAVDLGSGALGVIHSDTPSGDLGAASVANGNVVYEIDKETTANVFAVGDVVDVNLANNTAELAAAGTDFGICTKASSATDTTVWARFQLPTA
ncbi:MAG: capsid cement protein [Pirellulales bacterium]